MQIQHFLMDETGAVTVDWVVLTAAVVGLGGAVMLSTGSGTTTLASNIKAALVDTMPDLPNGISYYMDQYFVDGATQADNAINVFGAITSDAPEGYVFSELVDYLTGYPIYIVENEDGSYGSLIVGNDFFDTTDAFLAAEAAGDYKMVEAKDYIQVLYPAEEPKEVVAGFRTSS